MFRSRSVGDGTQGDYGAFHVNADMKIVQICPSPFPLTGGPAKNYFQFQKALGSSTVCFIRPGEGDMADCTVKATALVKVSRGPLFWRYYYSFPWARRAGEELVSSAECVIIHSFFQFPAVWASRLCARLKIPYVVVLHGAADPWVFKKHGLLKSMWMRLYGDRYLSNASAILCACFTEYKKVSSRVRPEQAKIVHWACEPIDTQPLLARRAGIRKQLLIRDDDRVLVYFGRLDSMKRPEETVRMCQRLGTSDCA